MILRFTVRDADTGTASTVEVSAKPRSTVACLLAALPIPVAGRPCYVGTERLDETAELAGSPVLAGATLTIGAAGDDPRTLPAGAVGAVRVVAGPDAGTVFWLGPGDHGVGRADADLRLRDPTVSRAHLRVGISRAADGPPRARVHDLGSTNRAVLVGRRGAAGVVDGAEWRPGTTLGIGDTRLEWVPLPVERLRATRADDARLDFDRAFAVVEAAAPVQVRLPPPAPEPSPGAGSRSLVSAGAPLLMGLLAALLLHQPAMLLLGLLSPVTLLATWLLERRGRRARAAHLAVERAEALAGIEAHAEAEERLRRRGAPDLLDLTLAATGAGTGLWPSRGRDPLTLRLGSGSADPSVELIGEPWPGMPRAVMRGVPVTVDLRAVGVLGIVGAPPAASGLARWVLVQLATLRCPGDLRIVVITAADTGDLAWTSWLPHVDGREAGVPCWIGNSDASRSARVAELKELVTARVALRRGQSTAFMQDVVVVVDGAAALRRLPGMDTILRDGPSVGVYVVAVDRHSINESAAECAVDAAGALRLTPGRTAQPVLAQAETVGVAAAERIARAIAPMRDRLSLAAAETALPDRVRFLDLLGVQRPAAGDVLGLWTRTPGPTTRVPLGADGAGAVTVDLAGQGPHAMLAGATGAGKSILLQTLVTSLLMANRPDELNLVLVDFKGGGAFLPFAGCPHVVGLIRSTGETAADVFDAAAAVRVLASVRAEVRRRESLLARFGGEIEEYWRAREHDARLPALPRLVLVFDEFARVVDSAPGFLPELVAVAGKGRSLGMHLILATQSLQGRLPPELRNNIALRISLRQNEPADSIEVLGCADAASIPGRLTGRGLIMCTTDEARSPRPFQSGYLGRPPPTDGPASVAVRIVEWPGLGAPRPPARLDPGGPTDQALAIRAIEDAATRLALPAPFRPLLPPLPATLPAASLDGWTTSAVPASAVPFGLIDDPGAQAQPAAALDLAGTERWLVAGGPQSGRTTLARALLSALAARFPPDQVHVYVVERRPGALADVAEWPHCGGVLSAREPDRIRRLVTWLAAEIERRAAGGRDAAQDPWIVVVVDGWEVFEDRADPAFIETSLLAAMRAVIANGPPVRVHVVPLADEQVLRTRLPDLFAHRVLLPFAAEESRRAHLPPGVVSPPPLPGRAVDAGTGLHLQVCQQTSLFPSRVPSLVPSLAPASPAVDAARRPRRFPPLPQRVALASVRARGPCEVPLGVGGPDMDGVGVDLFDAGPHLLLVSGPPGSGRTSTAATMARGLRSAGVGVLALAQPRSPLPEQLGDLLPDAGVHLLVGSSFADADLRAVAARFEHRYAVLVDDCDRISVEAGRNGWEESPTLLADIASPAALGRRALVLCGDAVPIITGQRRALQREVVEAATTGTRLLLCPSPQAMREHGVRLEADQFFDRPAGRGYLASARSLELVQVALFDPRLYRGAAAAASAIRPATSSNSVVTRLSSLPVALR